MTWILFLLCLAIAGRELYLAFDRKRPAATPGLTDVRARLDALEGTREESDRFRTAQEERTERLASTQVRQVESLGETDARIRSLIAQINDRMLPEVNSRLAQQREALDRLSAEVARLRGHLTGRLDLAVAASLGADPVDTVAGALGADATEPRTDLDRAFEWFAGRYGMRVELTDSAAYRSGPTVPPGEETGLSAAADAARPAWQTRYYLSGRSPRGLERDFIDLLRILRTGWAHDAPEDRIDAAQSLLGAIKQLDRGGAQIGPLVVARTPESLVCGVLPLAELRDADPAAMVADPANATARLGRLPEGRYYDASAWSSPH